MMPWLTVVGVGEDGLEGLAPRARRAIEEAEVLIGSARLLAKLPDTASERLLWPEPFSEVVNRIRPLRGRSTVVLATGDPLNYGVARKLLEIVPASEITVVPGISAFSLAAARMGWSLPDTDTLTLHGRPVAGIESFIQPGARLLVLTADATTVAGVARRLVARGYGPSTLTVLENMGGPREHRTTFRAEDGLEASVSDLNTLAIHCVATPGAKLLPRSPGLPDDAFVHDGQITKREVRAATVAALAPVPDALLWDVGAGCGSVAIEWMRAARGARALAFEKHPGRLRMMSANADALGTPRLEVVAGLLPGTLAGKPEPQAIFLGGAVADEDSLRCLLERPPLGRPSGCQCRNSRRRSRSHRSPCQAGRRAGAHRGFPRRAAGRIPRHGAPHAGDPMAGPEAVTAGTLYGLGVGPGDAELLTLKAVRILQHVDVVAYPEPNGEESFARRIVAPLLPERVLELPFTVTMKKSVEARDAAYDEAADRLAAHLHAGRNVAVLCEGDPFFYGSFMYLHERLGKRFPTVVVPGVTSLTACAASLGRPVAAGADVLKVIPATVGEARLRRELLDAESVAIIKVGRHFDCLHGLLSELGLLDRAALVEHSTLGEERVTALKDAAAGSRPYFSTVLVYKGMRPWR